MKAAAQLRVAIVACALAAAGTAAAVMAAASHVGPPWPPQATSPLAGGLVNAPEVPSWSALKVTEGEVPAWLDGGTFYRNVPAQYNFGNDVVRHWFDAMAQIQAFRMTAPGDGDADSGGVQRMAKFLQSDSYVASVKNQNYVYTGVGTTPHPGPLFPNASAPPPTPQTSMGTPEALGPVVVNDNDVNIVHFGGKFFAMTDRDLYMEFDGETLETGAPSGFVFPDKLTTHFFGQIVSQAAAHGVYDAEAGEYWNYVQNPMPCLLGGQATHTFWKLRESAAAAGNWTREAITMIKTANASYAHSFGLTKNYVVWMEQPLVFNLLSFAAGHPVADNLRDISSDVPTRMHIISRSTGETVGVAEVMVNGGGCNMHTANVFEDTDGSIVYDTTAQPGCMLMKAFELENMLVNATNTAAFVSPARLVRCRVAAPGFTSATCAPLLPDTTAGLPQYNKQFARMPYRYVYAAGQAPGSPWYNQVLKIDVTTNRTVAAYTPGANIFIGESIFVPQFPNDPPTPDNEDAGAMLAIAFNATSQSSEVLALNATDMTVMMRAATPDVVPLHFHGIWCGPKPSDGKKQFCTWD